jgi:hypothetical protein
MPIVELPREHVSRYGAPRLSQVDTRVFALRYFQACMECRFCHDACCAYGVDVDAKAAERIASRADELEPFVSVPRTEWFTDEWVEDDEHPGGRSTRTRVRDGGCVFRNRSGRGCLLHGYSLAVGLDYHELKPMVSALFPLTFDRGILLPSEEAREGGGLVCSGQGPTLYRGVRDELVFYFGDALVSDLDAVEGDFTLRL